MSACLSAVASALGLPTQYGAILIQGVLRGDCLLCNHKFGGATSLADLFNFGSAPPYRALIFRRMLICNGHRSTRGTIIRVAIRAHISPCRRNMYSMCTDSARHSHMIFASTVNDIRALSGTRVVSGQPRAHKNMGSPLHPTAHPGGDYSARDSRRTLQGQGPKTGGAQLCGQVRAHRPNHPTAETTKTPAQDLGMDLILTINNTWHFS
jgi:hypothetical protein